MSVIARRLVGYYFALRVSASVATSYLPFEPRPDPQPVVRLSGKQVAGIFDQRELVPLAGGLGIVTVPRRVAGPGSAQPFSLN